MCYNIWQLFQSVIFNFLISCWIIWFYVIISHIFIEDFVHFLHIHYNFTNNLVFISTLLSSILVYFLWIRHLLNIIHAENLQVCILLLFMLVLSNPGFVWPTMRYRISFHLVDSVSDILFFLSFLLNSTFSC